MKKILQVFRRLFVRKRVISGRAYVCDPWKNTNCLKEGCWDLHQGPCKCTVKKKYAKLDADGKPIVATDADICNLEWLEMKIMAQQPLPESRDR